MAESAARHLRRAGVSDFMVTNRTRTLADSITEEVERMMLRLKTRDLTPTIIGLQEQLEQLRMGEMERVRNKLGNLTPQQQEAVEALTRGIVNKIAHAPIAEMRRKANDPEGIQLIHLI